MIGPRSTTFRAPLVVQRLLRAVREAAVQGVGVLLVERHGDQALAITDRVYVMERGNVVLEGPKKAVVSRVQDIEAAYLTGAG